MVLLVFNLLLKLQVFRLKAGVSVSRSQHHLGFVQLQDSFGTGKILQMLPKHYQAWKIKRRFIGNYISSTWPRNRKECCIRKTSYELIHKNKVYSSRLWELNGSNYRLFSWTDSYPDNGTMNSSKRVIFFPYDLFLLIINWISRVNVMWAEK